MKNKLLKFSALLFFGIGLAELNAQTENIFIDSRDNTVYKTITIGTQIWMAENLRYLPFIGSISADSSTAYAYYVYDYNGTDVAEAKTSANYGTYGVLYSWETANAVCPVDWHLPSDAEWTQLTDYLDRTSYNGAIGLAGGKLKETGTEHWISPNKGATNQTGFKALPGGHQYNMGLFYRIGDSGFWWSATEGADGNAFCRILHYNSSDVSRSLNNKKMGCSVRCVKD